MHRMTFLDQLDFGYQRWVIVEMSVRRMRFILYSWDEKEKLALTENGSATEDGVWIHIVSRLSTAIYNQAVYESAVLMDGRGYPCHFIIDHRTILSNPCIT